MSDRQRKDIFQDEFIEIEDKVVEETDSDLSELEKESLELEQQAQEGKKGLLSKFSKKKKGGNSETETDEDGNIINVKEKINVKDVDIDVKEINEGDYQDYTETGEEDVQNVSFFKRLFNPSLRRGKKGVDDERIPDDLVISDKLSIEDGIDSTTLEELEAEERIRQRKEFAKAQLERKRADRRAFFYSFGNTDTLVAFAIYMVTSSAYLWWLNANILPSMLIAAVGSVWMTYWFVYKKAGLEVENQELQDLANFASQINFHMQNGKNVADTLEYVKEDYKGRVKADIEYTFSKLMSDGELVTSNFERYEFTAFDVFLRNLHIAYHEGIEPRQLFRFPLNNINFEWIERNNLMLKNTSQKKQEMMSVGVGVLIPASLRVAANSVYMDFLGYPLVAVILSTVLYFGILKVVTSIQRKSLDISVSL